MTTKKTNKTQKSRVEIQEFLIKVNKMTFLGEHNMVHTPTLEALVDEAMDIFDQALSQNTKEVVEKIIKLNKKLYDPIELGIRLEEKLNSILEEGK